MARAMKATWNSGTAMMDRSLFKTADSVRHFWTTLGLPEHALTSLRLPGEDQLGLPSSYKVGHLAQASIALSALTAALIRSFRNQESGVPGVTVPLGHAVVEFRSERFYTLDGKSTPPPWGVFGGLHKTKDGYVRVHDSFPNHREATLRLLGCEADADRAEVAQKIAGWRAVDLETAAFNSKCVISALRSCEQWDNLPQGQAVQDFPILIRKLADSPPPSSKSRLGAGAGKCLRRLRVLEMSRVIAAPVAGKTLAAYGADVLWVTSPKLPDLPGLDRDLARGKRTAQLDLTQKEDEQTLHQLLEDADVFIQGYRPGALIAKGFSPAELAAKSNEGIVCANMSAYGPFGPWSKNRGFDSLVQNCSGINVSEAEHYGAGEPARPLPCQALDHASGYLLATGIMAALYRQLVEGGSYEVDVSLAGAMKYLKSLGQFEGKSGFQCDDFETQSDVPEDFLETRPTVFGALKAVKHSAAIEGVDVGWDVMPKHVGSDEAVWLEMR